MDQQAYNRWWALHVRVALGETLAAADHGFYEAGMKERDADDELHGAGQAVGKARAALATLDAENAQLRAQSEKLNAEIVNLEEASATPTRAAS